MLSQSGVSGDLLIDDFRVLIDAHHPNIARMYDIFQDRKRFYIVQESLKDGSEDLHQRLQRVKSFREDQAIQIIRQILLALEFLHTKNILHRDLKSNNVSIHIDSDSGEITTKLIDFSLSVRVNPESGGLRGFAGTPEYMAPEVVRQPGNRALTPVKNSPLITLKADVFAVGILAYEVLTGSTAFSFACKSRMSLYSAILHQEPQFKERIFRKCSTDCIDFIKQCLLKKADKRPSVTDLLQHNWLNQERYEEMELAEMEELI